MKNFLWICSFVLLGYGVSAQTLSDFKTKVDYLGVKPKKKASKDVYIANFNVLVEVYREDIDYKAKREFRGKGRAEATSQAALGLKGVNADLLQQKVDQLYADMVSDLQAKGFNIIGVDKAAATDFYKKAVPLKGPVLRESVNPGMLEIIPTQFSGLASEKVAEKGDSKKQGMFPGLKSLGKLASGGNNALSKDLDDAIILDINLVMSWSETGGSWLSGLAGANAVIKTNLSLGNKAISAPSSGGFGSRGKEDYYMLETDFNVAQGSGLKKVLWKGYLAKSIYIGGVIEDTKVESFNRGAAATNYENAIYKVTTWTSTISENAKMVEVDGQKFADALYLSGSKFIDDQMNHLVYQYQD
ncbi:hypothetical protein [Nonlabens agnitus]|uniref:Uncharacterized protein n=1 Tax=Nonlabens agnitus TaxID=870484 RepID=A0A2S9WQA0_9FLAO|nr:hypothetical protein [Nonlabens agnitus]PRP65669.1 hypothetical protein BST86_00470 [Nonlabens agnitus]